MPEIDFCGKRGNNLGIMRKARHKRANIAATKNIKELDVDLENTANKPYADDFQSVIRPLKRKRGRPRRYDPDLLLEWRDHLIWFLESNWPQLKPAFVRINNQSQILTILKVFAEKGHSEASFMMTHIESLWAFLKSGRFHGDPRQIANAMTGAGSMSWRRSFDICGRKAYRCAMSVHRHALPDYINRRFHDRYTRLRQAKTAEKVAAILKAVRSHDPEIRRLKRDPEDTLKIFNGLL